MGRCSAPVRTPGPGADGVWATADDDAGDLRIGPASPVVDAGLESAIGTFYATDLAGSPRIVDVLTTSNPAGRRVDMGAYEAVPALAADAGGPYVVVAGLPLSLAGRGASTAAAAALTAASPVSRTGWGLASGPLAVWVSAATTASISVLISGSFAKVSSVCINLYSFTARRAISKPLPGAQLAQWNAQVMLGLNSSYRPIRCLLALMAERASRSASRRRSVSRLSQSCLPLATANSHFTRPLRK